MNIVLNAVLVLGLGWGLAGSASGTVAAQNAAAAVYLAIVARRPAGPEWPSARTGPGFGPPRWRGRLSAVEAATPADASR
jgi:MATE family, multidrug efflux pump